MMRELFITGNGELVEEEEWHAAISTLENSYDTVDDRKETATFTDAFTTAVVNRSSGKIGVLLSGGLDSSFISLVLAQQKKKFTCFSVGLEGSPDLESAEKVADFLGIPLKKNILSLDDIEGMAKKVIGIIESKNVVKVAVGIVGFAGLHLAKKYNVTNVFSGLGSEEIFAGYQRHADTSDYKMLHEECWHGLKNMWERDLVRDYRIGKHVGVTLLTPFLGKDVIVAAMNIHPKYKIVDGHKKAILAEIAEKSGLGAFARRNKKAAQYGSNVQKALGKIAKRNGFKYIKEYLDRV